MHIGILTGPLGNRPLEEMIDFAAQNGFGALEVSCGPGSSVLDTAKLDARRADEIKTHLAKKAIRISSLAAYNNNTPEDPAQREKAAQSLTHAINTASLLGVDVVCTLAGLPYGGRNKHKMIEEDAKAFFPPVLDYAASKGIKIALENWYATNIQQLAHFEAIFTVLPQANFGLNYDPSHLIWQDIDYIYAVRAFASRIFHTHAKDTEIDQHKKQWVGNQDGGGWWRYVIPGFGNIAWGPYISTLRSIKYDGVLSIEHEDWTFGPEPGFLAAKKNLDLFL